LGVNSNFYLPTKLTKFTEKISQVSTAFKHSLFLGVSGNVYSTGQNIYGELGINSSVSQIFPTLIESIGNVSKISTGYSHSMIISNGKAFSFGNNEEGKLGLGNLISKNIPTEIQTNQSVQHIITAIDHSILFTETTMYSFGDNSV
jgi:alpha-tubulin suppressor-like RCC1 family protein